MRKLILTLAAASVVQDDVAWAHVALTYPPARKYPLDFLDNGKTPKPCGMPKGSSKTALPYGEQITVSWHMGYVHNGGYKLELLDDSDTVVRTLVDTTSSNLEGKLEDQSATVTFEVGEECSDCTLRLERQAAEFSNYYFHSCADIRVVPLGDESKCSGHGSLDGSDDCQCDDLYFGDRCQFKNDCDDDDDCNGHGECLELPGGTALPRRQCFCQFGYMGRDCGQESPLTEKSFNKAAYNVEETRGLNFYWKIVNDGTEVEGVIEAKRVTSWVSVGWRPYDAPPSCRDFPPDAGSYNFPMHPMDCQDIVIASVREGSLSNVGDYYTRDRSTPQRDEFYGGDSDLTAAIGWEEDGTTTVMFRRPLKGGAKADHDFGGELEFIWAHGRDDKDFYAEDEIKYHGSNRGHVRLGLNSDGTRSKSLSDSSKMLMAAVVLIIIIALVQMLVKCHDQGILCFKHKI